MAKIEWWLNILDRNAPEIRKLEVELTEILSKRLLLHPGFLCVATEINGIKFLPCFDKGANSLFYDIF